MKSESTYTWITVATARPAVKLVCIEEMSVPCILTQEPKQDRNTKKEVPSNSAKIILK